MTRKAQRNGGRGSSPTRPNKIERPQGYICQGGVSGLFWWLAFASLQHHISIYIVSSVTLSNVPLFSTEAPFRKGAMKYGTSIGLSRSSNNFFTNKLSGWVCQRSGRWHSHSETQRYGSTLSSSIA